MNELERLASQSRLEVESLETKNHALILQVSELSNQNTQLRDKVRSLEVVNEDLIIKLQSNNISSVVEDLEQKLRVMSKEKAKLLSDNEEALRALELIKNESSKARSDSDARINDLERQISSFQVEHLEQQLLTAELEKSKQQNAELKSQIKSLESELASNSEQIKALQNKSSAQSSPNSSLKYLSKSGFDAKESEFQNMLILKDETYQGLKKEYNQLEVQYTKIQILNNQLEKNSNSHEKELLSMQREVIEKEKQILDLQRKIKPQNLNLSDLNSSQNFAAKVSSEKLISYEQKIERLHQTEQNLRIQVAKLESELEQSKRNQAEILHRQSRNDHNLEQFADLSVSRGARDSEFSSRRHRQGGSVDSKSLEYLKSEDEMLLQKSRLNDLNFANRALKDPEFEDLYHEVKKLREILAQKNDVIKSQEKNLKLCNDLAFQVAKTLEEMGERCKKLEKEIADGNQREQDLASRMSTMAGVIAELRKRNEKLEQSQESMLKEVNQLKGRGPTTIEESNYYSSIGMDQQREIKIDQADLFPKDVKEIRTSSRSPDPISNQRTSRRDSISTRTQERNVKALSIKFENGLNSTMQKTPGRKRRESRGQQADEYLYSSRSKGIDRMSDAGSINLRSRGDVSLMESGRRITSRGMSKSNRRAI